MSLFADIRAVVPIRVGMIQLYSRGYQPGEKARSGYRDTALCGAGLRREFDTVPLVEALRWSGQRWCRPCIGHAVTAAGLDHHVLTWIATSSSEGGPPCL